MTNVLLRREFIRLSGAALAAPALPALSERHAGSSRLLGASIQIKDVQTKDQMRELQARLPGLKYVDPWPSGRQMRLLSGADSIPKSSPEHTSFDPANDDSELRRFIDIVHEAGVKVFLSLKGWKRGGLEAPELMSVYIDGQPLAKVATPLFPAGSRDGTSKYVYETQPPLCPNRPRVQRWKQALAAAIAETYEADGITLRYSNFNQPGFYPGLFACWCEDCARAAADWGYHFDEMRTAMRKALVNFSRLDRPQLLRMAQSEAGFVGFFCELANSGAPVKWFHFRADSIMKATGAIRQQAEAAARLKGAKFGCMTFHPTFAFLVGQRYSDLSGAASYIVPQLLHWHVLHMQNFTALAEWFRRSVPGLSEREALLVVYRLFCSDGYPMPESIAAMPASRSPNERLDHAALEPIIASELHRIKNLAGAVEIFPMLNYVLWPNAATERLTDMALKLGSGAVWYQLR